jgi:hypothetical protein
MFKKTKCSERAYIIVVKPRHHHNCQLPGWIKLITKIIET